MFFIGVISRKNKYEVLKERIQKSCNKNKVSLININNKSISNLKNVKFDVIVILDSLEKFDFDECKNDNFKNLKEICEKTQYLLLDSDIEIKTNIFKDIKVNIITFGLNHKSSVTISSITDENIMISVQRGVRDTEGNIFEVGEYSEVINNNVANNIKEILSCFILKNIIKL